MSKRIAVVPELCSGCHLCELVCAIEHFGANNPKKAAIRVMVTYPEPVARMPIVCGQCQYPHCANACPVGALVPTDGTVRLDKDTCVSCMRCVDACPFGAIYVHEDESFPIKCDMCGGDPCCVAECPKGALRLVEEHVTDQTPGETKRLATVLSYAHMKEIEFIEKGARKTIRYADVGKEEM